VQRHLFSHGQCGKVGVEKRKKLPKHELGIPKASHIINFALRVPPSDTLSPGSELRKQTAVRNVSRWRIPPPLYHTRCGVWAGPYSQRVVGGAWRSCASQSPATL
jgi:hypothetical protein